MTDDELKSLVAHSAAETRRHFDLVGENLRGDVRLAVEAATNASEKIDRLGSEIKIELGEVRAMIRLSYAELEHRLRTLENSLVALESRVERLESGAA